MMGGRITAYIFSIPIDNLKRHFYPHILFYSATIHHIDCVVSQEATRTVCFLSKQ